MRAVIVTGGTINNPEIIKHYLTKGSLLIACDSGLNYVYKAGLVPDIILGDFDSADSRILSYYKNKVSEICSYPVRKDSTDTELGIFAAEEKGADDIILLGAFGSRIDHTLANIHIMLPLLKKGIRARIVDEHNIVELVSDKQIIENERGSYISILPLTEKVKGITTKGLDYPLDNADVEIGTSLTVSNVVVSDKAEITLKSGVLISIIARD